MHFRPLHDRVAVRRIEAEEKTAGGIIIPDTAKEKPQEGEVVAVGPGARDETGKLLQSGTSIDLKKWNGACDLTADRAGFLLTHDLETALTIVKAGEDPNAPVSVKDRIKELTLFAASEDYFALRQKLGIGIDN